MPAEWAHRLIFTTLRVLFWIPGVAKLVRSMCSFQAPGLSREVFGITFPNPVGLAAGFDKDARLIDPLAAFGFGFIEIGTLTPRPQPGNSKPRLFRLQKDGALINRMGFNNGGVQAAVERLRKRSSDVVIGGNIGKNKDTPNEKAIEDYEHGFLALYPWVDFFVVNVSSPNTPGLRDLQEKGPLLKLLTHLQSLNRQQRAAKPVLLKIAPDLSTGQLDDIIEIVRETGIDGIVATNTTIERRKLHTPGVRVEKIGAGGLSGKPLAARATEVIRYIHQRSDGTIPIIGVGGIFTAEDAREKLQAGASLVQVYTGFVYEGPMMMKKLNRAMVETGLKSP